MGYKARYDQKFGVLPIFGMIHLAGDDPVRRALSEIALFEEEGISGAIVENYHGSVDDVVRTLEETAKLDLKISIGVNILPNEFQRALYLAETYCADFIQLDHVAGVYTKGKPFDFALYDLCRKKHSQVLVLGGVWPKYYTPVAGSNLEMDLQMGMERADAIVVTGAGTGKETPVEKITRFRDVLGDHPLIIGAGLTVANAYQQLSLADGAIVGTALKEGNETDNPIDRAKVRDLMDVVKKVRSAKEGGFS